MIGDMISPVKAAVGAGYEALDERLTAAIHIRFGLPAKLPAKIKAQIKKADKCSAWLEATQIAGFSQQEANRFFGKMPMDLVPDFTVKLRPPNLVKRDYISKYQTLISKL